MNLDQKALTEMLEARIGQDFDGECHLTEHEARQLIAALSSRVEAQAVPVAWRYRGEWAGKKLPWQLTTEEWLAARMAKAGDEVDPLYAHPAPADAVEPDYFAGLVEKARAAAANASVKFPQPNYVTLKIAEEAGEVVRGAVHYAEGRMEWSEVEGEIVQLVAMLIRFVTEGDQINGVRPPALVHPSPSPVSAHPDDLAVDRFAAAMKAKLAKKREEGRGGWDDPEQCTVEFLSQLLHEHVGKGDPVDVGNLAMMLHQRGASVAPSPVSAPVGDWTPTHRHVKRGTEYEHIGTARLQSDEPLGDMAYVEVYLGHDGDLWARNWSEFHDGRFEDLRSPAVGEE